MKPGEIPWDMDKRLKCMIHEADMNLTDGKQCKWFVASLLPHLRVALSEQKIGTQAKALEITMRLHEKLMQDTNLVVQQIQTQLQNLCLEFQSMNKDRAVRLKVQEEVWCLKCKSQGHEKYHCPIFANHVGTGGPIRLRPETQVGTSVGSTLLCDIYHIARKHVTYNCHLLQKFLQTL